MRVVLLSFFVGLLSVRCIAQQEVISFQHYGIADGLSDNNIRCLLFDREGYMWIGTNEGLNRFDGEEFFAYRKEEGNPKSLCGNVITDVIEDKADGLWIATRDGGICHLNKKTGAVFSPKLISQYSPDGVRFVHSLEYDQKGRLVVATDKGVYLSNENLDTFHLVQSANLLAAYDLILQDQYIRTSMTGQGICTLLSDSMACMKLPLDFPFPAHTVRTFFKDSKGNIWMGCWDDYLHKQNNESKEVEHIDFKSNGAINYSGDEIISITEVSSDLLWLCMKSGEVWQYDVLNRKGTQLNISDRETARLNGNRIYCSHTDAHNRTWIGTDAGLHVYNPLNVKFDITWLTDPNHTVTRFNQHQEGLLIGNTGGLLRLDEQGLSTILLQNGDQPEVHEIFTDENGNLVIGTNESVLQWNPATGRFHRPYKAKINFDINAIPSTQVNAITSYKWQKQYFQLANAYGHGTLLLLPEINDWALSYVVADGEMDNLVKGFYTDSDQSLWFFGSLTGVSRFENLANVDQSEVIIPWDTTPAILHLLSRSYSDPNYSKDITGMIEYAKGKYWLATQGSGLLQFDATKSSQWYTPVPNSPLSIRALVQDHKGTLWMSANGALFSYQPSASKWQRYDERDGIPAAGLSRALYADSSGIIYAGGNGFFIRLNPKQSKANDELPQTKITHMKVMDMFEDSLLMSNNLVLPFEKNFITFFFTSLCFNNAENCTFEYMLEGLDEMWRSNSTVNYVAYNKLPFGQYTFKVRAYNSDGIVDSNVASYSFTIRAPFYLRWWFIALLVLVAAAMLAAVLRFRQIQKLKLEKVRNKIARDLHDDIGSALGSISFFSETAKRRLVNKDEKSTMQVLEKMGSTSREMIENMHDIVWAVNPDNDSFSHVIERMKSFATDLAAANNMRMDFHCDMELNTFKLSMTERKNLFLIFKEALYNSCKYSGCDMLTVKLLKTKTAKVMMTLQDNGHGFEVSRRMGKGNGLKNMQVRADEIKARIAISSSDNGTLINITL